jgi:hypothetical protein
LSGIETEFKNFRLKMRDRSETFKFWDDFLHKECSYYVGLWLANRNSNWDLRLYCLKKMLPLFSVADRFNYAKILPHPADLETMPKYFGKFESGSL